MTIKYEISVSEIKALLELIQELCKQSGLSEVLTKSMLQKMNERDFK